ncbi:type IV pilus modification PilV family protein [Leptospira sp. GIMC2001]|uniref:type IV pilus modification PilV family protein n=1 Tax=Leptospira sp. GIMC2001 TaxID=1513297 RepID=UPI00234BFE11|nr:prepilin-type N-terminal cleavage/methylation domain-containing protein [Leptospira sp. GIMC2001]WCL47939.1 prepilin-type N-terminal cleavage/methylation domain-containing protein [Leptospira sp. GIMC2001]
MRIRNSKFRNGFTLIEVALALGLGAFIMAYTYGLIAKGIAMRKESILLANAVHLAKIKMAQVDSSTNMQSDVTKGDIPGYPGYKFETEIKEEELDLLKLASGDKSDKLKEKAPKDLLGDKDAGLNDILKNRGQAKGSETGGLIKVFRVKVSITYPLGKDGTVYSVETFRATKY